MKIKIRTSIDELEYMIARMKNEQKYGNMSAGVIITMEHWPNGKAYLQFEQACCYAECNGHYERLDESMEDYKRRTKA